jgi:hypothetical protein
MTNRKRENLLLREEKAYQIIYTQPRGVMGDTVSELFRRGANHVDALTVLLEPAELHHAVPQRKDGVIPSDADIVAGMELGAPLAHDDVARDDALSTGFFNTQHFRLAVATIS